MTDYVRVKDPNTGHHVTMTKAEHAVFGGEILANHDAVDAHRRPLPPKYNLNNERAGRGSTKE